MSLIDDSETGGFSFIWTIHNFSYCLQKKDELIYSPRFSLDAKDHNKWCLGLYPRGYSDNPNGIGFFLFRNMNDSYSENKLSKVFSIRTVKGVFKKRSDAEDTFSRKTVWGYRSFLEQKKSQMEYYLYNDSLTVRCRICKIDDKILISEKCYARTIIGLERITYNCNLTNFGNHGKEMKKEPNLSRISYLDICLSKGILLDELFEVTIKRANTNQLYFLTCVLSLNTGGVTLDSIRNEHWFEADPYEQVWTISFNPNKNLLIEPKQQYSAMYLLCDVTVSSGVVYNKIENTECGIAVGSSLMYPMPKIGFDVSSGVQYNKIENATHGVPVDRPLVRTSPQIDPGSWKDNLRSFYFEGKLSDLTIRTVKKEFPVHKAMLCAQSPVFNAMFERDMREKQTGVVKIEDMESDTVSLMLSFVYTGIVEDLEWGTASKLYFAADKYEMTALKRKCSTFLRDKLSTSNVCECLVLADMHQDQDLKSVAQEFFNVHATDIIGSYKWKKFMQEKIHLAAEAMHLGMQNLKM